MFMPHKTGTAITWPIRIYRDARILQMQTVSVNLESVRYFVLS